MFRDIRFTKEDYSMHYPTNADLPADVQDLLPSEAQDVYRNAFNSACETYKDLDDDEKLMQRKAAAHQVALSVVKKKYRKHKSDWRRKLH